jgi:serine/threonine-protein kinase
MRVLWAHLQDAPPDLRALLPDLPGGVADVVARALAKQPEERPASSLAFATELAAAAGAGS